MPFNKDEEEFITAQPITATHKHIRTKVKQEIETLLNINIDDTLDLYNPRTNKFIQLLINTTINQTLAYAKKHKQK